MTAPLTSSIRCRTPIHTVSHTLLMIINTIEPGTSLMMIINKVCDTV